MLYPVEIKANIGAAVADALERLGNPGGATNRSIWFAEDRDGLANGELRLLKGGVIIRVRSGEGRDDTTAKLRPCDPTQLQDGWTDAFDRNGVEYRIEGDWSGPRHTLAASAVSTFGQGSQAQVGGTTLHEQALTSGQTDFLAQCAKVPVSVSNLIALGPIASTKWSDVKVGDVEVDAERWIVADLDFLELSIRAKPKDHDKAGDFEARARKHQARLLEAIDGVGLQIAADTDNKTQRVLTTLAGLAHQ
ncbi:hypothetical protein [Mycobacterium sp.]|uniref:hypothetical protein n=1 Tax=Mycobacterium sp. TaxID=1785 RepID=UPI002BB14FC8|nr:hypothetical protein [Mycobacterium sp.]HTQ21583.1 hypothetical protein [Mycobacterium sp.]